MTATKYCFTLFFGVIYLFFGDVMSGKRGGAGRGQGRKPIIDGVVYKFKLSQEQKIKVLRSGGAKWLRLLIDKN